MQMGKIKITKTKDKTHTWYKKYPEMTNEKND